MNPSLVLAPILMLAASLMWATSFEVNIAKNLHQNKSELNKFPGGFKVSNIR